MPYVDDQGEISFGKDDRWKGYDPKIVDRVLPLIHKILERREETIYPDSRFVETGWESLEVVEMVMEIEEEFSLTISDEDAERIVTVGQLISYLKDRSSLCCVAS